MESESTQKPKVELIIIIIIVSFFLSLFFYPGYISLVISEDETTHKYKGTEIIILRLFDHDSDPNSLSLSLSFILLLPSYPEIGSIIEHDLTHGLTLIQL